MPLTLKETKPETDFTFSTQAKSKLSGIKLTFKHDKSERKYLGNSVKKRMHNNDCKKENHQRKRHTLALYWIVAIGDHIRTIP